MKIFNTMTRQKEEFVPLDANEVKIYACGPTVYNYIHIGNARPLCVFDTLRRYLEYRGYKVKSSTAQMKRAGLTARFPKNTFRNSGRMPTA